MKRGTKEQEESLQELASEGDSISSDFDRSLERLRSIFEECFDAVFCETVLGSAQRTVIIYIQGMSDTDMLQQQVIDTLHGLELDPPSSEGRAAFLKRHLSAASLQGVKTYQELEEQVLSGNPVLLIDGLEIAYALGLAKWDKRSIEEPTAEIVVRGPREGFTEALESNTVLLRRRIRSARLKMKSFTLGAYTKTNVVLAYIDDIASPGLVTEASERLGRIELDGILESSYIEELIEDNAYSPFPQLRATERPDVCAAALLEGRVVILMEGTPFALIAPVSLFSLLQSPEDYYQRSISATLIRWIRYLFSFVALFAPSFYVAILTHHQEMVPTTLLLSIAKSREDIPFPAVVEAFLMELMFEALREAGIRLPKQIGAAVSIVGALVIGQAATAAGLVSSPMVMVVAITGIASFMIPQYQTSIVYRILRFPLMLLSGMQGLVGLILGVIVIVVHLCRLRSFGEPYLSPIAPQNRTSWKDVLLRAHQWRMDMRPSLANASNRMRGRQNSKPGQNPRR